MTGIKPSFVESLFYTFFNLDPDRPMFYNHVFRMGRSIFLQLGKKDKILELDNMIKLEIEEVFKSNLYSVLQGYYNPRFMYSMNAYCKIGEGVDTVKVTRYDMTIKFEKIKNWIYDEINLLTQDVRFTKIADIMGT